MARLLSSPTEEVGRSKGGVLSENICFCFILSIYDSRPSPGNKNKTGFICEKAIWDTWENKAKEMLRTQHRKFQAHLGLFEALWKKCHLYNIKLVGESALAMFPEYLMKLTQDRGYWSRFLKIKTGLFGKWIASREQNFHLCFKNRLNTITLFPPTPSYPQDFDLDNQPQYFSGT